MVKHGSAKPNPSNIKNGDRKYAVIIKNATSSVGKFDITDKTSVEESVYALSNNTDIPDAIRKSAEYFTKLAADYHGVTYDVSPSPAPHVIIISDLIAKSAEYQDVPALSFGTKRYVLSDEDSIKAAEEYFLLRKYDISPVQRINVSRVIVKAAAFTDHIPDPVVVAYSNANYSNKVKEILETKAECSNDSKYSEVMRKLASSYSSIPVPEFLEIIESCDRAAEVAHRRIGIDTHDLLISTPEIKSIKIAALTGPKNDIDKLCEE